MHMLNIKGAFAGLTAGIVGLVGLFTATTPSAQATPRPDDCRLVARHDQPLCHTVQRQSAYAYATRGGNLTYIPSGRALVKGEVVHAGLTKPEMHDALTGYARDYAAHVTYTRSVAVDLTSLRRAHGTQAQYEVGFTPGNVRETRVEINVR